MRIIDSYYYRTESSCMVKLPLKISNAAANFVSQATGFYNTVNPDFPIISADEITECISEWSTFVNENLRNAILTQKSTNENELFINDPYQAKTLNEAIQNLEVIKNCSVLSIDFWLKLATASCASPKEAQKDLLNYINYLITEQGLCQPKSSTIRKNEELSHIKC